MKKYIITTDSTSDLPSDYLKEHNIKIVPIYYSFNNLIYGDELKLEPQEFYSKMRNGDMPVTMAANPDTTHSIFENLLKEGYDILHIAFSSALSGSYSVAGIAARDLSEEYPDSKIIVIDSLCASLGEGFLVHKAVTLKEEGKCIDEVAKWIEENQLNICHMFTVNDLFHLQRGGRVSKAAAIIGTLINVKPVLHVNNEGQLILLNNIRGRKKSLVALVDEMEARLINYDLKNDMVFISHGDCIEDAEYVAKLVKERFGIEKTLINFIGPTIGAHSGPGTIALFFMGNKR
ncbi:MAG TPA: DegV family protein [Clostridiales bacterium]|nr:DegV family protein [Clostridiales bacterium]